MATVIDELVLARTSPHHSMNYRSAVVYGTAREVTGSDELYSAARAITRHVLPGREDDAAEPRDADWRETLIVAMPLAEASAKVRTGPPIDDPGDLELDVWAGTLPLRTITGTRSQRQTSGPGSAALVPRQIPAPVTESPRRAAEADLDAVVQVFAEALALDPIITWPLPPDAAVGDVVSLFGVFGPRGVRRARRDLGRR